MAVLKKCLIMSWDRKKSDTTFGGCLVSIATTVTAMASITAVVGAAAATVVVRTGLPFIGGW